MTVIIGFALQASIPRTLCTAILYGSVGELTTKFEIYVAYVYLYVMITVLLSEEYKIRTIA